MSVDEVLKLVVTPGTAIVLGIASEDFGKAGKELEKK